MFKNFLKKRRNKDLQKIFALSAENRRLKDTEARLESEKNILKQRFNVGIPGVSIFSGEPLDEKNREAFVGDVHIFFDEILKKKIENLVAEVRQELASITSGSQYGITRNDYDWFLRGTENALWKLYEWGETLSGEHQQNIINKNSGNN